MNKKRMDEEKVGFLMTEVVDLLTSYKDIVEEFTLYSGGHVFATDSFPGSKPFEAWNGKTYFVAHEVEPDFSHLLPQDDDHILSMVFGGALRAALNYDPVFTSPDFMERFNGIFRKYEVFYELLTEGSLTCYPV